MATATFVQEGDSIDYTPGVDLAAGDVVAQGVLIGVAMRPIPANTLGALRVRGIVDLPKEAGAVFVEDFGEPVYWDPVAGVATPTSTAPNQPLGATVRPAAASDTTVRVLMTPSLGA
jgi:predicted RecA/RadA family phage recombinase